MSLSNQSPRLVHLDALRGVAALVVVIGHIRAFVLVDFEGSGHRTILNLVIYFIGGMGHSAVLAFFALSGFLVGGSTLSAIYRGSWRASRYFVARLARLWTVLIPALLLTWALDWYGQNVIGSMGYLGTYHFLLSSGPMPEVPSRIDLQAFTGNLLFLQTIVVPVFGTNGPLWSLSNEFWYYIVFPVIAASLIGRGSAAVKFGFGFLRLCLMTLLPFSMMLLGIIWIVGALMQTALQNIRIAYFFAHPMYLSTAILAVCCAMVFARLNVGQIAWDLLQGLAWSLLLPALAVKRNPVGALGTAYKRVATSLSEISFTLYATHFPVLSLIYFTLLAPQQWQSSGEALSVGLALLVASLVVAGAFWWLFERNTLRVRQFVLRKLRLKQASDSTC